MLKLLMMKQRLILIILILLLLFTPLTINYLKNEKIGVFKQSNYENLIEQTELELRTLIKEKQNTTATIAIGLANNRSVINSLENTNFESINLKKYSNELRNTTEFKNVWFQLINKEGISIQRSWTDYKGDKISNVRKDLKALLKNPKTMNSISVGKFDLTFKTMTPIYDRNKKFLGIIEVLTHFNSISRKLKKDDISTIILGDKAYRKQLTKPFTKKFVKDYYIANLDADIKLIKHLNSIKLDDLINKLSNERYLIDKKLNQLISYYSLKSIDNKPMGHFLMFHPLDNIDTSKINEISYFYNILMALSILAFIFLIYLNINFEKLSFSLENLNKKLLILILIIFVLLCIVMYKIIEQKYKSDIESFNKILLEQSILEYNSILNKNSNLAELIFSREIDTAYIKELIKKRDRKALYNHLETSYKELVKKYNIRQLHFHLSDSTSFLRMHRPNKFGDSLKEIRQSVEYVNRVKKPYIGFEEGRIYNGFRHVFPLFQDDEHIGSVEVSYDIYSFIDEYLKTFNVQRVNFLINKEIVNEKVFKSEKSNYMKSPIEGFYFDKIVLEKLESLDKPIVPKKKDKKKLAFLSSEILKGNPFVKHFEEINEVVVIIPLINKINGKVAGSIHVSKSANFIKNRTTEFNQLIITVFIILAFIMVFTYREILSKIRLNEELKKNQVILDSQKSFIIITDGVNLKASNKSMLDFFGFDNLEEFLKEHDCICDYFEKEQDYITKQMGELNWFEYVYENIDKDNLVQMENKDGKKHIYYIELNLNNKINEKDYIVSFIDITHIKKIENQLIQSEKMVVLGEMIGNIAHQWRQPLSAISTCATTLKVEKELNILSDESLLKKCDYINDNAQYLSKTIDDFKNFIKGERSKTKFNLDENINSLIHLVDGEIKNNYLKIKKDIDKDIILNSYPNELTQCLINIINNSKDALKRIENEKLIFISAFIKEDKVNIVFKDNAGGIPNDILPHVFEPYFTTKHQSQGTGLGLHMTYNLIVNGMNGTINAKNVNYEYNNIKYTGTEIKIILPVE